VSQRLLSLAKGNYGWPIKWLAGDPQLKSFQRRHKEVLERLSSETESDISRRLCNHLALCLAGFETLARIAGAEVFRHVALEHAQALLRELEDSLHDAGETAADLLYHAVLAAAATQTYGFRPVR
jgi:hypothetical protein